jgi:hypothetical protein
MNKTIFVVFIVTLLFFGKVQSATIYDESINGDTVHYGTSPSLLLLTGSNEILGASYARRVSGGRYREDGDGFVFTLAADHVIESATLTITRITENVSTNGYLDL